MKQTYMTAVALGDKIRKKEISPIEAVEMTWEQIAEKEAQLNSYITLDKAYAMDQARQVQKRLEKGEPLSALAGVPVAVKDNICTSHLPTTCGSRILEKFMSPYDAEVVQRLQHAGAVIIGKTNMDEFAMGSTTETSIFGPAKNPHHLEYCTGGSSGGSCSAVAAGECGVALGSDTGGSIRQPAAHCGVVGIKPTYGTVSRYGLVAYASSMDQIGTIGRDVTDCVSALEIISGYDEKDSTSYQREKYAFTQALKQEVKGMRIGIPKEYLECDSEVSEAIAQAARVYQNHGAIVESCSLPLTKYAVSMYYIISSAEASSNLARYDGVKYGYRNEKTNQLHEMYKETRREGFGSEVKRRIILGTFVLSSGYYEAYYRKAMKARVMLKKELNRIFQNYDLLLFPTAPSTAPRLGESFKNPIGMYQDDMYTIAANLTGAPAISLPCGVDKKGMPIGMQLMGHPFREDTVIQAAYSYERFCEGD